MKKFAVLGNPIAHSKSPTLHQYFAKCCGIEIQYDKLLVEPQDFDHVVKGFFREGGSGVNITVPFKEEAYRLLHPHLTDHARLAQSVNTIYREGNRLVGENTDGWGLVTDIQRILGNTSNFNGARIALLGAGGAARGAIPSLVQSGAAEIYIANRTLSKAEDLAHYFQQELAIRQANTRVYACPFEDLPLCDIVINATASSLARERLPVSDDLLTQADLVYDMLYQKDGMTSFLAQCPNARTSDGLGMLIYQGLAAFQCWTHKKPNIDFQEIEALLRL